MEKKKQMRGKKWEEEEEKEKAERDEKVAWLLSPGARLVSSASLMV